MGWVLGLFFLPSWLLADEVLRIMAANTSSGKYQAYESPGIRIFQGLEPDVVLIQEFNFRSGSLRELVDQAFGPEFGFFVEPGEEQIPNGIISRYPILEAGEWIDREVNNRDFVWARIDVPGERDLWVVSVHWLTSSSGARTAQARELVRQVRARVPEEDYLLIGGDLNVRATDAPEMLVLSAVVEIDGRAVDQHGATGTNASRRRVYDWLLPDSELEALEVPVLIEGHATSYAEGLVFDSRVFTPIEAVYPVQVGDSGVPFMQHMAVIRDFRIPD